MLTCIVASQNVPPQSTFSEALTRDDRHRNPKLRLKEMSYLISYMIKMYAPLNYYRELLTAWEDKLTMGRANGIGGGR